jgi:glycosyltransferase 2 family protein
MKYKPLILLAIGIGILVVMILFIGPGQIENALKMANIWYVVLAIIIQFAIYGLWTYRWSITTNSVDISVKKLHLFPMLMVGLAVNNLTPSARGGGEPVRAYILSKYSRAPLENSFATVIADRGLDMFPFILLAILTIVSLVLFFNLSQWIVVALISAVILIIIIFFMALYMSFNKKFAEKVSRRILGIIKRFSKRRHSKIENKVLDAIGGFQDSMKAMIRDKKVLMYGIPLSFLIWFFEILRVYIVFSAFNVEVSLIIIAEVFIIASLIGMIPLLPGGLGAVDGMMIVFYSFAGIPPSISAGATVVERLISFWMTSIIGVAMLPYFGSTVVEKISKKL